MQREFLLPQDIRSKWVTPVDIEQWVYQEATPQKRLIPAELHRKIKLKAATPAALGEALSIGAEKLGYRTSYLQKYEKAGMLFCGIPAILIICSCAGVILRYAERGSVMVAPPLCQPVIDGPQSRWLRIARSPVLLPGLSLRCAVSAEARWEGASPASL